MSWRMHTPIRFEATTLEAAHGRPRARRRPAGRLAAALAGALLLAAGCGGGTAAPAASSVKPASAAAAPPAASPAPAATPAATPTAKHTVLVSFASPAVADLPYYAAEDEGFFSRQGLNVKMVKMAPNVAVTSLDQGSSQFMNSPGDALNGAVKGMPFKIVFDAWQQSLWVLVGKASIHSVAGLRGKTIGTNLPGTTPYAYMAAGLKKGGLPVSAVRVLSLKGTQDVYAALQSGQIDAGVLSPPFDAEAEQHGFRQIAFLGGDLQIPYIGLATTDSFLASHPSEVVGVIRGLLQATAWIRQHPKAATQLIVKYVGAPASAAAVAYRNAVGHLTRTGRVSQQGLRQQISLLEQVSHTTIHLNTAKVVDYGPLTQAMASLKGGAPAGAGGGSSS